MSDKTTHPISANVVWHHATVTRARREMQNGHCGAIIWFTDLPGSGKSTLAHAVRRLRISAVAELVDCDTTLEICESRDVKGVYKKARAGLIPEFMGISLPNETPITPELTVQTGTTELEACVQQVIGELMQRGIITPEKCSDNSCNKT